MASMINKIILILLSIISFKSQAQIKHCLNQDTFYRKLDLSIDSFDRTRDMVIMEHIAQRIIYGGDYSHRIRKNGIFSDSVYYKDCLKRNVEQLIILSSKLVKYPNYSREFFMTWNRYSTMFRNIECLDIFLKRSDGFLSLPKLENLTDANCHLLYKSLLHEKDSLDKYLIKEELLQRSFLHMTRRILNFLEHQGELKNISMFITNDDIKYYFKTEQQIVLFKQSLYELLIPSVDTITLDKLKVYYGFDKKLPNGSSYF